MTTCEHETICGDALIRQNQIELTERRLLEVVK